MALGSVALGYAEPNVTRAVVDAIASGHVSGLSSYREVDVAERLCGVIPCADRVQFLKTGAEAAAAPCAHIRRVTSCSAADTSDGWIGLPTTPFPGDAACSSVAYDDIAAPKPR
jgi:acetylornithine/succinyldiaminopimelate/putrescine aminotransferase